MPDQYFNETIETFKGFKEVDAICLGGSRATGKNDATSDYDLYVYLNTPLEVEKRRVMLNETCSYMELDNRYWEVEDDCIFKDGIPTDIIYRSIKEIDQSLHDTLVNHVAGSGYSTCICYNVFHSKILYDPQGLYKNMQEKYTMPYPEELRNNIMTKNRNLLSGKLPSYQPQIEKAVKRNDIVSINHRITEFLASYFDLIFAYNRQFHPGEKRLIELSLELCESLPVNFKKNIQSLLEPKEKEGIVAAIQDILEELDRWLSNVTKLYDTNEVFGEGWREKVKDIEDEW